MSSAVDIKVSCIYNNYTRSAWPMYVAIYAFTSPDHDLICRDITVTN